MPALVTDKTAYKIGDYITFSLTGWVPSLGFGFGLGKLDGTVPWGEGTGTADVNGNSVMAFQIGANVPPGNWVLWVWDVGGTYPSVNTPITILGAEPIVPWWVWVAVPSVILVLGVGVIAYRSR